MPKKRAAGQGLEQERARRRGVEARKAAEFAMARLTGEPSRTGARDERQISASMSTGADLPTSGGLRSGAVGLRCVWCGGPIEVKARGPLPRWCSSTCRHRAWERARALGSMRVAQPVPLALANVPLDTEGWLIQLANLRRQIETGASINVVTVMAAVDDLYDAAVAHLR